jgi:plastocyanin
VRHSRKLALLIALIALGGCGDDDEGRVDAGGGAAVATIKVAETEFHLSPANPSVAKAGVVEFQVVNAGKVAHALEVEGPGGEVETDRIEPGADATLKADLGKAGRYEWYCPIGDHRDRGMRGEITVAGGGGQKKEDREAGPDGHGGY